MQNVNVRIDEQNARETITGRYKKIIALGNPASKSGSKCSFININSAFSLNFALPDFSLGRRS